jgi:phage recombination protein Bet
MTDALALAPAPAAPTGTREQLELIKNSVAIGATDIELNLYLYDCKRRGVHPLDRLIYFTKRAGRYTPIASIDYFRTRAAQTGEMAGSDDAVFDADARTATVTVYRLTRGVRYPYTATVRYNELVPDAGPNGRGDVMWRRMPHVMLGKCAEAAALRKGFPAELGGLYVGEELERGARPDFTTEATAIADQYAVPPLSTLPPEAGSDDARDAPEIHHFPSERLAALAPGVVFVTHFTAAPTKNPNVTRYTVTVAGGPSWPTDQRQITTINEALAGRAEAAWHAEHPIAITVRKGKFGYELATLEAGPGDRTRTETPLSPPDALPDNADPEIPF